jgi:hypothetical protein
MGSFGGGGGEGREMSFSIISLKTLTHTIKYFFYTLEGPMMSGLSAKLFSTCQMRVRWERKDHEDTS